MNLATLILPARPIDEMMFSAVLSLTSQFHLLKSAMGRSSMKMLRTVASASSSVRIIEELTRQVAMTVDLFIVTPNVEDKRLAVGKSA